MQTGGSALPRTVGALLILAAGIGLVVGLWLAWPGHVIGWVYDKVQTNIDARTPPGGKQAVQSAAAATGDDGTEAGQPRHAMDAKHADDKPEEPDMYARYGQTGDLFGGLNTLLAGIAGAAVLWAGYMQYHTMKKALADSEDERVHRYRQEFESFFFQLLKLSETTTSKLVYTHAGDDIRTGSRALDKHAYELHMAVKADELVEPADVLEALVTHFMTDVYDRRPSLFGPHYRLIVQTFEYVAQSALSRADRCRYADIARGQIGEGAVLMLALYGLTDEGRALHPLIEQFNLLEHLHRRYRHAYRAALSLAYQPCAFQRVAPGTAAPSASPFLVLDIRRRVAQHWADKRYNAQREAGGEGRD